MSMNAENRNTENNYAACTQYEAALEDYLQGLLRGPEAVMLAEHLQSCAGCRAALEDAAVSARLLAVAEPAPDPGAGFSRIVMARIRQQLQLNEGKSIWRPVVSVAWRFAATAAFALLMLVSFDLGRQSQLRSDQSIVAENRVPEIAPDRPPLPANRDEVILMMADTSHGKQ
jgi:predicted anti-sigma-YlaC factor YlaD